MKSMVEKRKNLLDNRFSVILIVSSFQFSMRIVFLRKKTPPACGPRTQKLRNKRNKEMTN